MRYIGSKILLLEDIYNTIVDSTKNVKSIIDVFAGSGAVSKYFKLKDFEVYSNDFMYFSYVMNRGMLNLSEEPSFKNLGIKNPIDFLNNLTIEKTKYKLEDCFIYKNYSPNENCERMYFQPKNAIKIDIIRKTIEDWYTKKKITDDEYYYLLASLLNAIPFISNITGVYAAYLKYWDKRANNDLKLVTPDVVKSDKKIKFYNLNCNDLLENIKADLLYADPPYNSRQYLPNYHILETIAKYDNPEISGKTGMREYIKQKSDFSIKSKVKNAFETMIKTANVKYVAISYNNESLLSTEELTELCKKYSKKNTFKLIEKDYRRYKSKIPNNSNGLKEQIYIFEKELQKENKKIFCKSPMNYTGGKYKLLPQLVELFPQKINNFVDLFAGGCDVSTNIEAKKIFANDINYRIIEIFKKMQSLSEKELLNYLNETIKSSNLSMDNQDAYIKFRQKYNSSKTKNPLDLFILICYAFNHQSRFNSRMEFNTPFGKNRSSFNSVMRKNLINFHSNIQKISFTSKNFKDFDISFIKEGDFLYADPPYLITTGNYNDGKRGFEEWNQECDKLLFDLLDKIDFQGGKFALSNVTEHKGLKNKELIKWKEKYNTHYIDFNYKNSSYHGKNTDKQTIEVLITNY